MLLSLFKIVFFIVIITLVALCITYLLDNEQTFLGEVFINIGTTEFILSPIQTVIFLGLVIFLAILVLKLFSLCLAILSFINGDDTFTILAAVLSFNLFNNKFVKRKWPRWLHWKVISLPSSVRYLLTCTNPALLTKMSKCSSELRNCKVRNTCPI